MKLVQLLAKELKEWPEGVGKAMQDFDMEIRFFDLAGEQMTLFDFYIDELASDACDESRFAGGGVEITKSQWQAEREKMNKPKWIRHRCGNRCVDDDVFVEVKLRCGDVQRGEAKDFIWSHHCCDSAANIMAYRVIEETKDQEIEEVKKTNFGTITYKLEIDAAEATKEIDSLVAKWGQIESPLKWRDEIIELEAYEEEFRREREKLIRKLESEGFKLIDHVAPVYGEQVIDLSDWRNWKEGDIVECTYSDCTNIYTAGKRYAVGNIEKYCAYVSDDLGKDSFCSIDDDENSGVRFKLIQ